MLIHGARICFVLSLQQLSLLTDIDVINTYVRLETGVHMQYPTSHCHNARPYRGLQRPEVTKEGCLGLYTGTVLAHPHGSLRVTHGKVQRRSAKAQQTILQYTTYHRMIFLSIPYRPHSRATLTQPTPSPTQPIPTHMIYSAAK